ncbi:MAG: hypothetical protein PQJ59_01320 [Spirochaetales bacterium]|nr:hypothetical protein [Spirochaetales bacterium]
MNKTVNTILFMVAATLLNLILISLIFLVLIYLFSQILSEESGTHVVTITYLFSIFVAVGGGFFLYHKIIGWINKKWPMDRYLHSRVREK